MSSAFLKTHDLAVSRRDQSLFRGIDICLEPGEALSIEGPNGSGKSTLLRCLAGLLSSWEGRVERSGTIGWIGHENGFMAERTLREELIFWLGYVPASGPGDFGMRPLLDVPVGILSQGQKRRAALWRLLAEQADIWMLDEPAVGLDRDSLAVFSAAIANFRDAGGIVIAATHGETDLGSAKVLRLGVDTGK